MARPSAKSSSRDMLISMAVLLVPIVLIVWLFTDNPESDLEAVDVAPLLELAEEAGVFPILRAEHLPEPWKPVRVGWAEDGRMWIDNQPSDGNAWMVGYLGPDGIYYGIEQRDRNVSQAITRLTREGTKVDGTVDAAGWTWERYESDDGRTVSLVAQEGDMAAVVYADSDFGALDAFVTSLTTGG
ncbi:MAG: DUF4245 domain-containing protein [Propionibacterium sp.]|nr:DUF4245 domain-containing protein [Propionibacterium sp.]